MGRVGRWLLNALTTLSLLLCVAAVGLWVRSYWRCDNIWLGRLEASTDKGEVYITWDSRPPSVACGYASARAGSEAYFYDLLLYNSTRLARWPGVLAARDNVYHQMILVLHPLWLVAILLLQPVILYLRARTGRAVSSSACRCCSYDLTGNVSGVCPECGTAIRST